MFRSDKCSIERPVTIKEEGEIIGYENKIIAVDIPCHLSVKDISRVNQTQSTAEVLYDYKLFIDTRRNITIEPNDIIYVRTKQGQEYTLRAGESHKYPVSTQTHCEVEKNA